MSRDREAEFNVQNSRDNLRVVISREFLLVKFEHERDIILDLSAAHRLARFLLDVKPGDKVPG